MLEENLTIQEKKIIWGNIKLSLLISLVFSLILIFAVGIFAVGIYFFANKPKSGMFTRVAYISALLFIPFLFIALKNLTVYRDLRVGKKLTATTNDYNVVMKGTKAFLVINHPIKKKFKIDLPNSIAKLDHSSPIKVVFTKYTGTLLSVSQYEQDLLDNILSEEH